MTPFVTMHRNFWYFFPRKSPKIHPKKDKTNTSFVLTA